MEEGIGIVFEMWKCGQGGYFYRALRCVKFWDWGELKGEGGIYQNVFRRNAFGLKDGYKILIIRMGVYFVEILFGEISTWNIRQDVNYQKS